MEDQGEAVRAYGTCPLCKALHHPGGREEERERERSSILLGKHVHELWETTCISHQLTLSRSDSRNGINCKSSESDSSMNQLAIGIPLSS